MAQINSTSICTFNCRSVKSILPDMWKLCDSHDTVLIQEHWRLPFELQSLSSIHPDFLAFGTSAVDVSKDILQGRPYGGTGILYHRSLAKFIKVVDTNDSRMTAIKIQTKDGPILLVNVYMPVDYGTAKCTESYSYVCSNIDALFLVSEAVHLMVLGDFNCDCNKLGRFMIFVHSLLLTMI